MDSSFRIASATRTDRFCSLFGPKPTDFNVSLGFHIKSQRKVKTGCHNADSKQNPPA